MRSRLVFLLSLLFLAPLISGAQVSFSTIADELSIRLDDVVQVQFIAENATQIEDFQPPAFKDFRVMHGPIETSGMSMVNNEVTQYKAFTYILQPLKKGRLSIPGASALINGKKMQSNKLVIEVGDAAQKQANPYPMNPGISQFQQSVEEEYLLSANENASDKIKGNLLVKLELDKKTAFVGEPIVASYKLYTRLRSESRVSKRPSMNGFSVYDMVEPDGAGPTIETLNGKSYQVHIIRKTQLFPLQEGEFTLEPVELENVVRFLRSDNQAGAGSNRSPLQKLFDDLMTDQQGNWEEHRVTLSSEPERIVIRALPDNAPSSFNGAVGNFSVIGKMTDTRVVAGDNALLEFTIEGQGNLPLINAPQLILPDGFAQFDPQVTEEINKMVAPMEGYKKFQFAISPDSPGTYLLPPVKFSFFDPKNRQYKTVETDSLRLEVTPSVNRNVRNPPAAAPVANADNNNMLFWVTGILGVFVLAGMVWLLSKKQRDRMTVEKKSGSVQPVATENIPNELPAKPAPAYGFEPARAALLKNDAAGFYRSLDIALWEVIDQKLDLPGSSQQKPRAVILLAERGLDPIKTEQLRKCWQQCDWALYAPGADLQTDPALLKEAEAIAAAIERL